MLKDFKKPTDDKRCLKAASFSTSLSQSYSLRFLTCNRVHELSYCWMDWKMILLLLKFSLVLVLCMRHFSRQFCSQMPNIFCLMKISFMGWVFYCFPAHTDFSVLIISHCNRCLSLVFISLYQYGVGALTN